MLGTGNALVTECYNTCFVLHENQKYFMVDGGGGNAVLHQLKYAGLDWRNMREIFVTHKHLDHLLGILWMIRVVCQFMSLGQYEGEINIYGHCEVIKLIRDIAIKLLSKNESRYIDDRLHLIEVYDGDERIVNNKKVAFFDIHSTKAKQFGFCMEIETGERLTCCGDEPFDEFEKKYVEGSKWLMHEAFCLDSEADIFEPYAKRHSTVKDACLLAERMCVKNLILYHT